MGNSVNAYLFYGFDIYSEDDDMDQSEEIIDTLIEGDLEELYVAKAHNLKSPWDEIEGDGDDFDYDDPVFKAKTKKYSEEKSRILKELGVSVGTHCSGEYPMYYLSIHEEVADRGDSTKLNLYDIHFEITKVKINKLKEFCRVLGIEYKKPSWNLAAYSDY